MHSLSIIIVISGVTVLLRFLPFMLLGRNAKVPNFITYLGKRLPYAIMGMLIIYCLRDVSFRSYGKWLPSAISVAVVAGLHVWKRNTLLSIILGTICYMLLVQYIFV